MKKPFAIIVVFGLGVALGRLLDGASRMAGAGGGDPLPACQDLNGDGQSNIADAVYFLSWLFRGGAEPTCPPPDARPTGLPGTGQTTCYDKTDKVIPCAGTACPGQDGLYRLGCPPEGRFLDQGDGTVTDACTGLLWRKDTSDVNGDGQVSPDWIRGGDTVPWCEALAYCEEMSFAGHDDWRLPTIRELESIVDYGRSRPAADPIFDTLPKSYWSSTTVVGYPESAWLVHFEEGVANITVKGPVGYVRAVRGMP
ncbi:MAG: DUF1566 domain-containing protein [Planctomycetes bacterium]|nr:DUF1566 domain-containing protein [Planctomycetota bacterium]